jgi:hypothetical protein
MPYHQVVSYAYSRSKKMDTRCWCRRNKFYIHYVFQIQQVVKGASMVEKSTLCIGKKLSALQEPYNATVYHALHGLAQRKFDSDGPVATSEEAIFPSFGVGKTTASLRETGT